MKSTDAGDTTDPNDTNLTDDQRALQGLFATQPGITGVKPPAQGGPTLATIEAAADAAGDTMQDMGLSTEDAPMDTSLLPPARTDSMAIDDVIQRILAGSTRVAQRCGWGAGQMEYLIGLTLGCSTLESGSADLGQGLLVLALAARDQVRGVNQQVAAAGGPSPPVVSGLTPEQVRAVLAESIRAGTAAPQNKQRRAGRKKKFKAALQGHLDGAQQTLDDHHSASRLEQAARQGVLPPLRRAGQ